jgi:hypothetical protein
MKRKNVQRGVTEGRRGRNGLFISSVYLFGQVIRMSHLLSINTTKTQHSDYYTSKTIKLNSFLK